MIPSSSSGRPSYTFSNSNYNSSISLPTKTSSSMNALTTSSSVVSTSQSGSGTPSESAEGPSSVTSASTIPQSIPSSTLQSVSSSKFQQTSSSISSSVANSTSPSASNSVLPSSSNPSSPLLSSAISQSASSSALSSKSNSTLQSVSSSTARAPTSVGTGNASTGLKPPLSRSSFPSGSQPGISPNTTRVGNPSAPTKAPFPITSSPSGRFSKGFVRPSGLPASGIFPGSGQVSGSAPFALGNASMSTEQPWFYVPDCTPVARDPWQDARSCQCKSELYSWYHSQSTGMLTTSVCHTTAGQSYGLQYSSGCSPTTETLLATAWDPSSSCCNYCAIAMPTVRLVFWEPQTAASNFSTIRGNYTLSTATTVVDDGFTL